MIPIFIITCNRIGVLKKSMQSYHDYIKTPFEIVICDQGSTFNPMIKFLERMESDGTIVYKWKENLNVGRKRNLGRDNIGLSENIQNYFKNHPKSNYVVCDPDIVLDNVDGDIFEVYAHLLNIKPEIVAVGSVCRIDDIPDCYPLKEKLLSNNSGHARAFLWPRHTISYKGKQVKYIFDKIDTGFGMFRAGTRWQRMKKGIDAIRTFAPYSTKHLDWYICPENLSEDQRYYMQHASKNAHWSKWGIRKE